MSWEEFDAWERETIASARIGEMQDDDVDLFDRARAAVPHPWSWPAAPHALENLWWNHASPAWHRFAGVLHRYAAAKVFGSWAAYKADGVDGVLRVTRIAAAVLRIECTRQCAMHQRPLDRALLKEAIRQSDLLLVHYADPDHLAGSRVR